MSMDFERDEREAERRREVERGLPTDPRPDGDSYADGGYAAGDTRTGVRRAGSGVPRRGGFDPEEEARRP